MSALCLVKLCKMDQYILRCLVLLTFRLYSDWSIRWLFLVKILKSLRIEAKKPYDFDRNQNRSALFKKEQPKHHHGKKNRENLNWSNTYGFWANNLVVFKLVERDFSSKFLKIYLVVVAKFWKLSNSILPIWKPWSPPWFPGYTLPSHT